jgi:hypothetical protein
MIKAPIKMATSEFEDRMNEMATSIKSDAVVHVTAISVKYNNHLKCFITYLLLKVEFGDDRHEIVEITRCKTTMEVHLFGGPLIIRTGICDYADGDVVMLQDRYIDKHPEWEFMREWVSLFGSMPMFCDLICKNVPHTDVTNL